MAESEATQGADGEELELDQQSLDAQSEYIHELERITARLSRLVNQTGGAAQLAPPLAAVPLDWWSATALADELRRGDTAAAATTRSLRSTPGAPAPPSATATTAAPVATAAAAASSAGASPAPPEAPAAPAAAASSVAASSVARAAEDKPAGPPAPARTARTPPSSPAAGGEPASPPAPRQAVPPTLSEGGGTEGGGPRPPPAGVRRAVPAAAPPAVPRNATQLRTVLVTGSSLNHFRSAECFLRSVALHQPDTDRIFYNLDHDGLSGAAGPLPLVGAAGRWMPDAGGWAWMGGGCRWMRVDAGQDVAPPVSWGLMARPGRCARADAGTPTPRHCGRTLLALSRVVAATPPPQAPQLPPFDCRPPHRARNHRGRPPLS